MGTGATALMGKPLLALVFDAGLFSWSVTRAVKSIVKG